MPAYEDDVVLSGGNVTPVVRRGDAVHRGSGPWTPAVHRLLHALGEAGIEGVPRALGYDDLGREVLSFVPGETLADAAPAVLWSESVLLAAARLLRRLHDASVPLAADAALTWRSPRREPAEVICHNDFATYNLLVTGDALSGVIDFDFASPGPRMWDLAYFAYRIVPLAEDAPAAESLDRRARLESLIAAYGARFTVQDVVAAAADRLDDLAEFTRGRFAQTERTDFLQHAAMYERDAGRLRTDGL
ncbi:MULTISPECIES: phosphotransferase [Microbacterium]|uniref:phosphotransferase n=1 Tax=Microbacterium TaxID=33882 RepID=UPI00146E8088|nr:MULTISPECIES: phosphotransferase [Microbacterium]